MIFPPNLIIIKGEKILFFNIVYLLCVLQEPYHPLAQIQLDTVRKLEKEIESGKIAAMVDPNLRIRQMSLDLSSPNHIPLNVRIAEFRQDPQNMDQMTEFVDDVINTAQTEANKRLEEKKKVRIF